MMKVPAAHPQPFSKPLREIARIIAERESDEVCVARLIQYLDARGVPLPPSRREAETWLQKPDAGCKIPVSGLCISGDFVQRAEFYLLPNYHFTLLIKESTIGFINGVGGNRPWNWIGIS